MKLVWVLMFLIFPGILDVNEDVFGLSCAADWGQLNEKTADAIFNGTVISKKFESNTVGGTKVNFQVDQSFKGRIHGLVNISTGAFPWFGGETIGDPFHVGKNYFVVAQYRDGNLFVGSNGCHFSTHAFAVDHWKRSGLSVTLLEPEILPPKHQMSNNVLVEDIICNEGLQLIFKIDDSPACVKPDTKQRLIERGWTLSAKPHLQNCSFTDDDLLNYLRNPHCERPEGIEIDTGFQCVYKLEEGFYVEAKCEEPGKAEVVNGCLNIKQKDGLDLGICP